MNKLTKYKVLAVVANNDGILWEENNNVVAVMLDYSIGKITHAKLRMKDHDDEVVAIDEKTFFLQEFTGMYDTAGSPLYGYDIVKPIDDLIQGFNALLPVVWINGAWCLVPEGMDEPIYLNQHNVMKMERIGTVYQHGAIIEKPIDEAVFEAQHEN